MLQVISFRQHRMEIHRALELLSDFYTKLTKSQEKQFLIEIERLIRLLKSRFFQALIDIQEYYEITLHDEIKFQKFNKVKERISLNPWNIYKEDFSVSVSSVDNSHSYIDNDVKWNHIEITILRGDSGLGFSIAGGIDNPHLQNDYNIYVTKIIPGGAAENDGQLCINDIIEKVNDASLKNISHSAAVEILKNAGNLVKLYVRRENYNKNLKEIELFKGIDGFGFSIAGGIGNQHIPGKNGIYITKIQDGGIAQLDGRLKVGQKIVALRNSFGYRDLENITHEEAVEALKSTQDKIILYILHENDGKCNFSLNNSLTLDENLTNIDCNDGISNTMSKSCTDDFPSHTLKTEIISSTNANINSKLRTIILKKGPRGLGFNIIGGEDGSGIYISYILVGGPADIDGKLQKGDKIITVNSIDFTNISHEEAAFVLKGTDGFVNLSVQHDIEGYCRFDSKSNNSKDYSTQQTMNIGSLIRTTEKKSMHVRALFDYDPNKDDDLPTLGLHFDFGNILHVTNASDDEWWLATKVFPDCSDGFGIIPAQKRWERKQRSRDRSVKFEGHMPVLLDKQMNMDKRKKNYSFSRKFPFMKNKDDKLDDYFEQEPFMLCYTQDDGKIEDSGSKEILYRVELPFMEELTLVYLENDIEEENNYQLCDDEIIFSYEKVHKIIIDYARPVIILGPIKDKINDNLITEYPEIFSSCVPHTTRQKRDNEIDGQDYHFVTSREKMEKDIQNHLFIEAGQYNENLYGTSIAAVKDVAFQGKHCILDVSGNAIKRLYAAQLYPIALFIKLNSPDSILNINKNISEDQAKKAFYHSLRIEREFMKHFTGIIKADLYEEIYKKVKENISMHSNQNVWISCKP